MKWRAPARMNCSRRRSLAIVLVYIADGRRTEHPKARKTRPLAMRGAASLCAQRCAARLGSIAFLKGIVKQRSCERCDTRAARRESEQPSQAEQQKRWLQTSPLRSSAASSRPRLALQSCAERSRRPQSSQAPPTPRPRRPRAQIRQRDGARPRARRVHPARGPRRGRRRRGGRGGRGARDGHGLGRAGRARRRPHGPRGERRRRRRICKGNKSDGGRGHEGERRRRRRAAAAAARASLWAACAVCGASLREPVADVTKALSQDLKTAAAPASRSRAPAATRAAASLLHEGPGDEPLGGERFTTGNGEVALGRVVARGAARARGSGAQGASQKTEGRGPGLRRRAERPGFTICHAQS